MSRLLPILLASFALPAWSVLASEPAEKPAEKTAERRVLLPEFPVPPLAMDGRAPKRISSLRLLRELQRGGVRGWGKFDAMDGDYALFRGDSLAVLGAWLETACKALDYDLAGARGRHYDGAVFARLLNVATSIASLREDAINLAMPIGVLACRREEEWGELPGDDKDDAYVIFATDQGVLVYDPPTRQLSALAEFPNREHVIKVWF